MISSSDCCISSIIEARIFHLKKNAKYEIVMMTVQKILYIVSKITLVQYSGLKQTSKTVYFIKCTRI